jgi:HemY protein
MMKRLFVVLGALVIAALIGISIQKYPSVLVIGFGEYRIDIPFWVAVFLLVISYITLHIFFEGLRLMLRAAKSLAHFGSHYRKHRARALIRKGLLALNEGNYVTAEKALAQGAQESEISWFSYLSAAKAAQALDDETHADEYLQKVTTLAPDATFAAALLQIQYYLKKNRFEEAIPLLTVWNDKKPNHPLILKDLQKAYLETENWEALSVLLPKLKRNHILSKEAYLKTEREVWKKRLGSNIKVWKDMPSYLHSDPVIVLGYAKALVKDRQFDEAETILRQTIKHDWDDKLVRYYGTFQHTHPEKSLSTAEGWISRHTDSAALLLTLARLCVQAHLWGKAHRYFEASLSIQVDPVAYAELAALLEKINKPELSIQYYKKAALLPKHPESTS